MRWTKETYLDEDEDSETDETYLEKRENEMN